MSLECNPCHQIATGKTLDEAGHFSRSYGSCETCHKSAQCAASCYCMGAWDKAAKRRDPISKPELADDLLAMRQELLDE